jgi:hypothetical protein
VAGQARQKDRRVYIVVKKTAKNFKGERREKKAA